MAKASATQVATFIDMIAPLAIEQAKKHNNQLFPSVTIAQAGHETGWGTSQLMMRYNAPYGFKVGNSAYHFGTAWKGASYNAKTTEYYGGSLSPTVIRDNFRAYDSLMDATEDYMDLLCHASRYKGALNRKTPEESIAAIVAGGYATGPSYSNKIIEIIRTHNLKKYDPGEHFNPITPELIYAICCGEYGDGSVRKAKLTAQGYNYEDVRAKINALDKIGKSILPDVKDKAGDYWKSVLKLMLL